MGKVIRKQVKLVDKYRSGCYIVLNPDNPI